MQPKISQTFEIVDSLQQVSVYSLT